MLDQKPKRRPSATGKLVGTRFQTDMLDAIDAWRRDQEDLPTRPEAIRRLVELGMSSCSATSKVRAQSSKE